MRLIARAMPAFGLGGLFLVRSQFPERGLHATGSLVFLDSVFSLAFTGFLVLAALAAGGKLLSLASVVARPRTARWCFSFCLGYSCLAYGAYTVGLLGALRPQILAALLLSITLLLGGRIISLTREALAFALAAPAAWRASSSLSRGLIVAVVWSAAVAAALALAPPTAYDGLMYHLEGPRLFLKNGSWFTSTARWWINMPSTIEAGYLYGVAFGSDSVARLLHVAWAGVYLAGAYLLARHWAGRAESGWTVAILIGMPMLALRAIDADIDLGWASFEVLAVVAFLQSREDGGNAKLVLSGVLTGLALGSKYIAALGALALVAAIILDNRRRGAQVSIYRAGVFLVAAGTVAAPWYLRNWVVLGDPAFPFLGGGAGVDPERLNSFLGYAGTFGPPSDLRSWLALPWRAYSQPLRFAERFPPSPLLLGALLYLAVRKSSPVSMLAFLALLRYGMWSIFPALHLKYLIPVFPLLATTAAYAAARWRPPARTYRPLRTSVLLLAGILVLTTPLVLTGLAIRDRLGDFLLGRTSRDGYWRQAVPSYAAIAYARDQLPPGSVVLTTGDGRLYLCRESCYNSDDQLLWVDLLLASETPQEFSKKLSEIGVTQLLISHGDAEFFAEHTPGQAAERALEFLDKTVLPECGRLLFSSPGADVIEISCSPPTSEQGTS